ncbi:MAG: DUF3662 and FHA domain-containing protein [Eggerthellaceae bacterium]|nr:DUF3662 and FHA domain-containing protein [Eggerthellaceae bacterium]
MGLFSKFEDKMEDAFDNAAEKMFDVPISPVQIAKKAEKQMKRERMVGAGKQYAPTLYTVLVNPDDDERFFGYYPTLAGETETYLATKAADAGLITDGAPLVRFIVDNDLRRGKFEVIAEIVAAPIVEQLRKEEYERYGIPLPQAKASAAGQAPAQQKQPLWQGEPAPAAPVGKAPIDTSQARLIDMATNQTFLLLDDKPSITVGRDTTNDIIVNDINASRQHAELRLEPQGFWSITDLKSTNGTFVNGCEISACALSDGDSITIGLSNYVFRFA